MTKQEILDQIAESIATNGLQKINGVILNTILTAIAEIIPDDEMLTSSFGGGLTIAEDPQPTSSKWWFATEIGTYTHAGNIVTEAQKINIIIFDGTVWKKLIIPTALVFKTLFNVADNASGSTDKAIFNYLKSITFDGKNMVLQGNNIDTYVNSQFSGWSVYMGSSIGSDGNGNFALIPSTGGGNSVVYKDLDYPLKPLKIIVEVEQASDNLVLIMDDSTNPPTALVQNLTVGTNTILWDATGHTDKTVIIRNYSTTQSAKIRSIVIKDPDTVEPETKIPLNIEIEDQFDFQTLKENRTFVSGDFQNIGSANVNLVGGVLGMSGSSSFSKHVQMNYSTLHENSDLEFTYQENSASGTFFGFRSQNPFGYNHNVYFAYHTNGAQAGKIEVLKSSAMSSAGFSTQQNTNYTVGDKMKMKIRRKGLKYTFFAINLTKGWKIEHTIQTDPLGNPFVGHNESKPSVICYAGNVSVYNWKIVSYTGTIENYIAGDSITFGQSATTEKLRWAYLVKGKNLISGGGADVTVNVKNRLEEIKLLKPKRVLLMIGGNDILFNVPAATYQQNLIDIRNELTNSGIEVVHCYPTPRSGASTLINFINSEPSFATDLKIDTNTLLSEGDANTIKAIYDSGDHLHPNIAGMAKIAEIINGLLYLVAA